MRCLLLVVLLGACTSATSTGIQPVSCPPDSTLTYASFGEELIANHCLECHDHEGPTLLTQSSIRQHASEILDNAVYTDAMPEDADMPLMEREKLGEWLACGAP